MNNCNCEQQYQRCISCLKLEVIELEKKYKYAQEAWDSSTREQQHALSMLCYNGLRHLELKEDLDHKKAHLEYRISKLIEEANDIEDMGEPGCFRL